MSRSPAPRVVLAPLPTCAAREIAAELIASVRGGDVAELEEACELDEALLDRLERTPASPPPRRLHEQAVRAK